MRHTLPALALALAPHLAPAAAAQGLDLDVSGGIANENWRFTLNGGQPGDYWVLAFADTMGPTPIVFVDPNDSRYWDLDLSMFSYAGAFGVLPAGSPCFQLQNVYFPTFYGAHLYGQAFTLPGATTLVDLLSNNIAIVVAPGHGASVDTIGKPSRSRAFMPGARLPNGNHIVFGGNDGALQGGTYLASVDLFERRILDVKTAPAVPDLSTTRSFHQGIALNDGRVLVCGGNDDFNNVLSSAEIYDPATNTLTPTGSMSQARYFHSLVKLADGRVMALGGSTAVNASGTAFDAAIAIVNSATDAAEIYDPSTGQWTPAAKLPWKRTGTASVLLNNGKVLVATGAGPGILSIPSFYRDAALYNPANNSWQTIAQAPGATRALATAAALPDGRIVLSGGAQGNVLTLSLNALADVSIYTPGSNSWAAGAALPLARAGHSATLMPSGQLVVCGGAQGNVLAPNVTTQVDAFDGTSWTTLGALNHERAFHYAGVTHDGERVFLYGGIETGGISAYFPTCELFAP